MYTIGSTIIFTERALRGKVFAPHEGWMYTVLRLKTSPIGNPYYIVVYIPAPVVLNNSFVYIKNLNTAFKYMFPLFSNVRLYLFLTNQLVF